MKQVRKLLLIGVLMAVIGQARAADPQTPAPSCKAHYTWTQSAPNIIAFSDTSSKGTNIKTAYHWSFGDGTRMTGANPSHTFNIPGLYNVCLRISDSTGCHSTYCDTVRVTGAVICNLSLSFHNRKPSCTICQDGSAQVSVNGGTRPFSYSWSNGASTSFNHHLNPGIYSVCVTDANGCKACMSDTVTLRASTCQAHFTWKQTLANTIVYNDSSSVRASANTRYEWTYGDGQSSHGQNPSHIYLVPGLYTVCLSIEDTSGCDSKFCDTVRVNGKRICTLIVDASQHHASCDTCKNGSATVSNISGGTAPYQYSWSNGATTHSIHNILPGVYTVCVTDTNGCKACTVITVTAGPHSGCDAEFDMEADTAKAGNYIVMNMSSGRKPLHYSWNWGDGSASDTTAAPQHTYATPGIYQICLTIKDSTGCTSTECENMPQPEDERHAARLAGHKTTVEVHLAGVTTGITERAVLNEWVVFPNPTSENASIRYAISQTADVRIDLYDLAGNQVMNLSTKSAQQAGQYEVNVQAQSLPAGTYLLGIRVNAQLSVKRLTLLK